MRIAHIIDPLIGVIPDVYLTASQDRQWHQNRIQAFERVCSSAVKHSAEAILITGRLFADSYVTDALILSVLEIIRDQPCPVVWLPDRIGAQYLRHNENVPENLFLLNSGKRAEFILKDVRIFVWSEKPKPSVNCNILLIDDTLTAETAVRTARTFFPELYYAVAGDRGFVRQGGSFREEPLVKIENTGFDDKEKSGYYLLKLEDGKLKVRGKIEAGIYSFNTVRVNVEAGDDFQSVCGKCALAASDLKKNDFVRIILNGTADSETFIRTELLRDSMKESFFCLEVYNNCVFDPVKAAYNGDISLESEFVRSVLADDTLSEAEKCRVIQCGRNALCGKELSE